MLTFALNYIDLFSSSCIRVKVSFGHWSLVIGHQIEDTKGCSSKNEKPSYYYLLACVRVIIWAKKVNSPFFRRNESKWLFEKLIPTEEL